MAIAFKARPKPDIQFSRMLDFKVFDVDGYSCVLAICSLRRTVMAGSQLSTITTSIQICETLMKSLSSRSDICSVVNLC